MSDEKKAKEKESALTSKSLFSAGGMLLILFILILINIIFSQVNLRWDSTSDKLYSLSEGTKKIVSDLEEDVTIKVFYTKDNVNTPVHIKTYARRMLDFLSEYEYHSDGKIIIEVYDVKTDSEEEDWARSYGIEGINLPMGERIYFGLVAMAADQEETIKMVDPSREEHLEYDITRMISRVQSPEKQKIGIISGLPVLGQPPMFNMQNPSQGAEPWLFVTELKKTYTVEEVSESSESIDKDIDLLLIFHPKDLKMGLQYAVDQYVLRGGNAIVLVDPFPVSDSSSAPRGQPPKGSSLEKLFAAWGVKMDSTKVVADFDYSTQTGGRNNQVEDNPLVLSVNADAFNKDDITTAKLEKMLFPIAGAIEKDLGSDFEYKSLVKSSKNSSMTESFRVRFGTAQIRRDFKPSIDEYDLAVRIRGKFKTAFPSGKPEDKDSKDKPEDSSDKKEEHLTEGEKKSTIVIVSDVDMLFDAYYIRRQSFLGFNLSKVFNDNLNFLLNTSEMLTGSEELISIRSRGKFERPFIKVQELEKRAQARWLVREQELVRKADETNRKLREFDKQKDKSQRFIMSPEQEAEIQKFREEKKRINKELKQVRRNLRADIEALGNRIKFYNIFLMPMLVSLAGIGYGVYRRNKSFTA
ncbi:GldG family protein [Desulfobacterales bacterium HSG2]|nr:GldG family protein [Desulfobacterales bacterium HSG2]